MAYKPKAGEVNSQPNVVPMADIMLVLLIIFMVITPMLQKGFSVDMAKVPNPQDLPDADKDDAVLLAITRDGSVYLGSNKIAFDQITNSVKDRVENRLDKTVFIRSDARAKYGDVVRVVDEVRSAGVDNVGLLTQQVPKGGSAPAAPGQPGGPPAGSASPAGD
jgi:biopolymer transport protein ExbD